MERLEILTGNIWDSQSEAVVYVTDTVLSGGTEQSSLLWAKTGEAVCVIPEGQAVVLPNQELAAQKFVCACGPQWTGGKGGEVKALTESYHACFDAVRELGVGTLDVPSIPTGIYDSQLFQVATVVLRELDALLKNCSTLQKVRILCQDEESLQRYMQAFNFWFAVEKSDRMKFD